MTKRDYRSAAGFSLVEMMIVVGLAAVLTGIAVAQVSLSRQGTVGDGGMRVVLGQMNQARQTAIQQRRYVRVVFTTPNLMQVVIENTTSASTTALCLTTPACTVLTSPVLEGNVQFGLVTSVTTDTPDAFGNNPAAFNGSPVAFGSATFVRFAPDGTLVNQNGVFTNGTVFLAIPSTALSQRAVTVLGATGRVRGYRWIGNQWNVV
jgi:prepilin-type N-terminal cleavage/methylation domain-containing protein